MSFKITPMSRARVSSYTNYPL